MISVEEAKRLMMGHVPVRDAEQLLLQEAAGRVLAEDVMAPHDHPLFDMSAVDGYAIGDPAGPWEKVGSIAAGEVLRKALHAGECARIFTGAQVPANTYAIAMQEVCTIDGTRLGIQGAVPASGSNIRRKAEGTKAGEVLMHKGMYLGPTGIGLLASSGVLGVAVTTEPVVSIVRTGGEFIDGERPEPGRIFSSNEHMLMAAVRNAGLYVVEEPLSAADTDPAIGKALLQAVEEGGLVICTGGVSVGDHDRMLPVLKQLGATIHFHGVAQKPGKPMLFATLKGVPVFALPGNPRAVMVCFWEYVLPFLRAMCGATEPWPRTETLPLTHPVSAKGERSEFRAAQVRNGQVSLLRDEGSHMLRSLIDADALAYLPAERREWASGATIKVHYLPR